LITEYIDTGRDPRLEFGRRPSMVNNRLNGDGAAGVFHHLPALTFSPASG
jgi:hypothetical protein